MSGIRLGSYFDSTKTPLALLIFCLSTGIVLWRFAGSALVDDAYIYLSYARTLAFHGQWGLVPGLESNTATSALWVLVLSAVSFVIREPLTALGSLYVVNVVAMRAFIFRLFVQDPFGERARRMIRLARSLIRINRISHRDCDASQQRIVTTPA